MELNIQECIQKLEKARPDLKPKWWIEDQGIFIICALQKSVPENEAMVNIYVVDPKRGVPVGPVPTMQIYGDERLQEKIANANMIEEPVKHSFVRIRSAIPSNDSSDSFLMHYGIKGQRWGIRRFQNDDGTLTAEGKERYGKGSSSASDNSKDESQKKLSFREKRDTKTARYAEEWQKGMSSDLTKVIDRDLSKKGDVYSTILTDVALTVLNPINVAQLGADGLLSLVAKKKLNSYLKNRETKSELDPKTGLYKKKEGSYDENSDLAAVNPGFLNMNSNTKNNCMLCTTAYDLRQRGYDVTAQLDSQGYNFGDLKRWYPKAKLERTSRFDERGVGISQKEYMKRTVDNLVKQGDGARGNIMVLWTQGGAHSMCYEIQNGKLIFKDGQANKVFKNGGSSMFKFYTSPEAILAQTTSNTYARLDNVEPDLKWIKKECVR